MTARVEGLKVPMMLEHETPNLAEEENFCKIFKVFQNFQQTFTGDKITSVCACKSRISTNTCNSVATKNLLKTVKYLECLAKVYRTTCTSNSYWDTYWYSYRLKITIIISSQFSQCRPDADRKRVFFFRPKK